MLSPSQHKLDRRPAADAVNASKSGFDGDKGGAWQVFAGRRTRRNLAFALRRHLLGDQTSCRQSNRRGGEQATRNAKRTTGKNSSLPSRLRAVGSPAKTTLTVGGLSCGGHGFSASAQVQMICPQPGQPVPYFRITASDRSTPTTLAIVVNQASTSANSPSRSSCVPLRRQLANSPISSISHMNVPSTPR